MRLLPGRNPECVASAMAEALKNLPGDAGRGGIRDFNIFDQAREELAALMGIGCPERIALGSNSTWGAEPSCFRFPSGAGRYSADYKGRA